MKWVDRIAGDGPVVKQAIARFAADLRARLAGPNPSAPDTLLANRIILTWLSVNWAELQYACQAGEQTYRAAESAQKLAELAHRARLSACKALTKMRKAKLPDVLALVNVNPPAAPAT